MSPPVPLDVVVAVMSILSVIVRFGVRISIWPALPVPVVSTEIFPSPVMSMVSGAKRDILPPLPMEVVRAEIKPWLLKLISRSGLPLYGWSASAPAGDSPWVSANIPSSPEMLRMLLNMLMFPPASV